MATKKRTAAQLIVQMMADVAKLQTDMGKAVQEVDKFGKKVDSVGKTLKLMFGFEIAKTLGPELIKLTGLMNRFAAEGEKVSSIRDAFEGLGGSAGALKQAQQAVLGTVSAFDLMAVANKGLIRGIPQFNEQFGNLAELAQRLADAWGQETLPVLQQLTDALASGKTKGLEPFGFALDKNATRAQNQAEVFRQLQTVIDRLPPSLDSVANANAALDVKMGDVAKQFGMGVNASSELIAAYRGLGKEIDGVDWEGLGGSLATINAAFVNMATTVLPPVVSLLNDVARGLDFITGTSRVAQIAQVDAALSKMRDDLERTKNPAAVWLGFAPDPKELEAGIKLLELRRKQLEAEGRKDFEDEAKRKEKLAADIHAKELKFDAERARIAAQADAKRIEDKEMAELDALEKQWAEEARHDQERRKKEQEAQKKLDEEHRRNMVDSANELFAGLEGFSDALGQDLSRVFATMGKFLSDEAKQGIGEFLGSLGLTGTEASAYLQAGSTVISSLINARRTDKANQDNSGTGAAVGGGAGGIAGAIFGGPAGAAIGAEIGNAVGGLIGSVFKWGSQNPETNARHAFANFVEEGFKRLGQVSFFDSAGKLQNIAGDKFNFIEGDSGRFSKPDWGSSMDSWGAGAKETFLGLGEAFKELQGITEDVGSQIGFLLGENLAGNIDNARLLVQQLGLSFEDMATALENAAKRGSISWHEFEVDLKGVGEAFKPGLEAFGDVKGAVDEIVESGGRGQAAIKGIKDLAQEAKEEGAKTAEDLRKIMMAQGVDGGLIDTIMDSLKARGVETIEEILALTDRGAGGIIAEMYSQNEQLAKQWDEMGEKLKGITDSLKEMDDHLKKELEINVKTNIDSQTQDLLNAGVLDGTGLETAVQRMKAAGSINLGSVGELSGASLRSMNSSLRNASSAATINIDARGAAPGVSAEITNALATMETRVVQRTLNAVYDAKIRGAL